ncbi:MAG TPA: hypothetical protein VN031_02845 [Candidatus Microsaccharimonas sp.]|nr:hypothetical protein [Candidatus Microsaccharimonas sp.]
MSELMLGLFPQPEDPPEEIIIMQNGREVKVKTEDLWAYSADAMHQPPTGTIELQGEQ